MSNPSASCRFCTRPADTTNDLYWELGDIGVWCGLCTAGREAVPRHLSVSEISKRRNLLRAKRPASEPAIEVLDKMLTNRFPKDLRS
jgi:hypothetical protein